MALKGDRYEFLTKIDYFGNSVMTRGGCVSYAGLGSGAALDQSVAFVQYAANSSGAAPVGLLLGDMVSIDLTRQHINHLRDEVIIGGKVCVGKKGWWVTNNIIAGTAPIAVGDRAVLCSSGNVTNMSLANEYAGVWNKSLNPAVGRFESTLDEDGYAKVAPDL